MGGKPDPVPQGLSGSQAWTQGCPGRCSCCVYAFAEKQGSPPLPCRSKTCQSHPRPWSHLRQRRAQPCQRWRTSGSDGDRPWKPSFLGPLLARAGSNRFEQVQVSAGPSNLATCRHGNSSWRLPTAALMLMGGTWGCMQGPAARGGQAGGSGEGPPVPGQVASRQPPLRCPVGSCLPAPVACGHWTGHGALPGRSSAQWGYSVSRVRPVSPQLRAAHHGAGG